MDKSVTLKPKKEPRIYPYFRPGTRKSVQEGCVVVWYEAASGKRQKKKFMSEADAKLLLEQKTKEFALEGTGLRQVVTTLTQEHMPHVERALRLLEQHQFLNFGLAEEADQLVHAVEWFVANYRERPEDMPTVAEFVPVFLTAKKSMAVATQQDYKKNLDLFAESPWGKMRLDEVTAKEISEFIGSRKVGKTTQSKYYGAVRALFYFACRKSDHLAAPWLTHNPATDVMHPPKPSVPRRIRYTVEEVKRLIQASIYLECAPLVVLRLFTMLRAEEAERLIEGPTRPKKRGRPRAHNPWLFIDLDLKKLEYHEDDTTAEANRDITLYPVLIEWLKFFRAHKIPFETTRREETARRVAVPQKFGDGFDNLIRHTAISFRTAICGSLLEASDESDNKESIIRKHYYRKVTPEDAKAVYALTPEKFDLRTYTEPGFPSQIQRKEVAKTFKGIDSHQGGIRSRRKNGASVV